MPEDLAEHLEHLARRARSHAVVEHRGDPLLHVDRPDRRDLALAEHRLDVVAPTAFDVRVCARRHGRAIDMSLPGWRWEIEFLADGSVDIERYRSVAGVENDESLLDALIEDAD